jgi:hypothetical protein
LGSDPIDAEAAARAVLSGRARSIPKSNDGLVQAIRALEVVCHSAVKDRTRAINQFKALLVTAPAPLREQMHQCHGASARDSSPVPQGHRQPDRRQPAVRAQAARPQITFLNDQITDFKPRLSELTGKANPGSPTTPLDISRSFTKATSTEVWP